MKAAGKKLAYKPAGGLSAVTATALSQAAAGSLPLLLTRRDTYAWYIARRSPARVGLTACTVNAIVLHKQRSRKSTKPAMCV